MNTIHSNRNSLTVYFIVAFFIPIVATTYITLSEGLAPALVTTHMSASAIVVVMSMVHAPTIAAILAAIRERGISGLKDLCAQLKYWKFAPQWYLKSLLIMPLTIAAALLILTSFSGNYAPALNLSVLTFGTLLGAFWEEIGWTGYATPRMLTKYTPLEVGCWLGLIHALWHLPASFWGSSVFHGQLYFIMFLVSGATIVILRVITLWIYARTGSLVLGWLTHASFTTGQLLLVPLALSSKETIVWQAAFLGLLIAVAIFVLASNRDLRQTIGSLSATGLSRS